MRIRFSSSDLNDELEVPPSMTLYSADAVVYEEYEIPGVIPSLEDAEYTQNNGKWTRFVCISDTHATTFNVPDGDVLLHSGDLTETGKYEELETTMEWLHSLPHKVKIIIGGNHDLSLDRAWYQKQRTGWHDTKVDYDKVMDLLKGEEAQKSGIVYLQNETYTFSLGPDRRQWSVYGSPWSPYFFNWAFNYKPEAAEELISSFPSTDILLTHGPPYSILDYTASGDFPGCPVLLSHLASGRLRPRIHVYGHIHESHGSHIHTWEACDAPSEPPVAQNRFFQEDTEDATEGPLKEMRDAVSRASEDLEARNQVVDGQRTVFANAANEPTPGRWGVPHGGPGFRPIVIDLKD